MQIPPQTRYARSGDVSIAYQVVGDGPIDLVYVPGWISNVEMAWEEPSYARFLRRLASFSRLILFDKRGTGLSDRVPHDALPALEQRMDDVRAVMDAVGSERAALFGWSEGGTLVCLFSATYPARTAALVTFGIFAKRIWSPDYPWAPTPEAREAWLSSIPGSWGDELADVQTLAPSASNDTRFRRWLSAYFLQSASPGAAVALGRMNTQVDIRAVLPSIQSPTLVLQSVGDQEVNVAEARYIARLIPGARLVELAGAEHLPFTSEADAILDAIEEFLTGSPGQAETDRMLATVLFTDIVGSTEQAAAMGDRRWRDLLDSHDAVVRRELARYRGREVKRTGDGFLATFDGPARAIRCGVATSRAVGALGIEVRTGLHTGEIEVRGEDVGGIAVHLAARVMAAAAAGEVLVSSTVRDLVVGSGIQFEDRGERRLKGVPGTWRLYAVDPVTV